MPARVHAILVVRPHGRGPTDLHLSRTLRALAAQTRRADVLTVVLCGPDETLTRLASESGAEAVIVAGRNTGFAEALRLAGRRISGDAVWLLAQDTAPAPDALARLAGALETAPSVALAAPKLVSWDDPTRIVSLGVTLTRTGRTVGLADGELDQGQHDAGEDVLGSDIRGVLVRAQVWQALGGVDPGLAGADEGLDLGIRARLAGGRVALAPTAIVAVAGDGVAGTPTARSAGARGRRLYAVRKAQLHRRLVYAPAPVVPLHWLSLLPLALWRTLGHLVAKNPGRIGPEWAASVSVLVGLASVIRARRTIRRTRTTSWLSLAQLRIGRRDLRERLEDEADAATAPREELRFFSGGGAWVVLGALATSLLSFSALLAWPVLGGGGLAPLRSGVLALWTDAAYGPRALGWDTVGPADPFAAVVALIGSLSPLAPSRALVILWLLALPLAALGGWFAATRVTERSVLRCTVAFAWAVAPTFLVALVEGRPAAVILHLALPWLVYTATAARRSWSSAGLASILLVIVVACAPSLAPALGALWLVALILAIVVRRGRGAGRIIWLVIPSVAVFLPLVWYHLTRGDPLAVFADPGRPLAVAGNPDGLLPKILFAFGYPSTDGAGWLQFLGEDGRAWWVAAFTAPVLVLALLGPALGRLLPASLALVAAGLGVATAVLASGIALTAGSSGPVAIWPGSALSLAWAGLLLAAVAGLDGFRRVDALVPVAASLVIAFLAIGAVPALTAVIRGDAALTDGPASTLPAYVQTAGSEGERDGEQTATLVLTVQADAAYSAAVVWGASETLGGQTTVQSTRPALTAGDRELAHVTADLVSTATGDVVADLARHGIAYVLLEEAPGESDVARAARLGAQNLLNQRADLVSVGETARGALWSVDGTISERTVDDASGPHSIRVALLQLGVIVVALLLAVPTRASLRAGRRHPRIIGEGVRL
ncbi:glycosyltransferase [Microbacterium sp. CnD16-F]|uniref:glycosyltransferase n=1 Tax=unclassified Microbacterium TaxID=2609290 RepID=UPI002096ACBC|nr:MULTISPECIES: glycosyltransferase [unclassified Microbacterium]MCO7203469.1 glycosyltransferase [Microbacterium sp. CnD16-F]MDT0179734.1 glycosyltransferase [Microbacterium sp. ARD31]